MRIIKQGNPPWTPELMCDCPMCGTEFALTQFEVEIRDGKPGATCPVCYRHYPLNMPTEDELRLNPCTQMTACTGPTTCRSRCGTERMVGRCSITCPAKSAANTWMNVCLRVSSSRFASRRHPCCAT